MFYESELDAPTGSQEHPRLTKHPQIMGKGELGEISSQKTIGTVRSHQEVDVRRRVTGLETAGKTLKVLTVSKGLLLVA